MRNTFALSFWILIIPIFLSAQSKKDHENQDISQGCGHEEFMQNAMSENPALSTTLEANNEAIAEWIAQKKKQRIHEMHRKSEVVTIPVVFHIIYQEGDSIPSEDELTQYMEEVNIDFRYMNEDAQTAPLPHQDLAADTEFEFCLAQRTPEGLATNGFTYTITEIEEFNWMDKRLHYSDQGGKDNWDPDQYLNIWLIDNGIFLGGYANFPNSVPSALDGVVIHFGFFDFVTEKSHRLINHEIGHWLNLYHVFSQCDTQGDFVDDTPLQITATTGCPTAYPYIQEGPFQCDFEAEENMYTNYMDYTQQACIVQFTQGQKERMQAAVNVLRPEIMTSDGCIPPIDILTVDLEATTSTTICTGNDVQFKFIGSNATEFSWSFTGGFPANSEDENPSVTYNEPGVYDVVLTASDGDEEITLTKTEFITVTPSPNIIISQNSPASSSSINDGSLQLQVTEGVGPYVYTIQPGNLINTSGLFENLSGGDYNITVENSSAGCKAEASISIDVLSSSNTSESIVSQINMSPNPSNGRFNISLEKIRAETIKLELLDVTGRVVKKVLIPSNEKYDEVWELEALSNGLYFLQISVDEQVSVKKMIIH